MDVSLFVREPNATEYTKAGARKFSVLPRVDEYISMDWEGEKKYFQIISIHHASDEGNIDMYAVRSEPPWELKKSRTIGFGPSGK